VGDAAIAQQVDLREGLRSLATIVSVYASTNNLTWPFVTVPKFEQYGFNYRKQSHTEVVSTFNLVRFDQKEAYVNYTNENRRQWVEEGHYTQKGSLERLIDPFGNKTFHPYISRPNPDGLPFLPDIDRDVYFPSWQFSPPPSSYGLINWNCYSVPDYAGLIDSMLELRFETLVSKVRHYVGVPTAMSREDHDLLHSQLADSSAEHPHSFAYHPIHQDSKDYESPIVGFLASGTAWDEALLDLLPDGVEGIHVMYVSCSKYSTERRPCSFRRLRSMSSLLTLSIPTTVSKIIVTSLTPMTFAGMMPSS
jgi:hypothetical protein